MAGRLFKCFTFGGETVENGQRTGPDEQLWYFVCLVATCVVSRVSVCMHIASVVNSFYNSI